MYGGSSTGVLGERGTWTARHSVAQQFIELTISLILTLLTVCIKYHPIRSLRGIIVRLPLGPPDYSSFGIRPACATPGAHTFHHLASAMISTSSMIGASRW